MTKTIGTVAGVNGNMVTVRVQGTVTMNEVAYIVTDGRRLKSEVIRVQAETVKVQVFEITRGRILGEQIARLSDELRTTSQRVNLFEKIKIPETLENIQCAGGNRAGPVGTY
jgi:V/A-type H+-transporting ATPase subunit A